ncbi:XRE family transcriptional regulator [Clostridium perfringens]
MCYKISLKNIKSYRKLKGYSQLRLAEEIGTSAATISRLENDREKAPRLDVIERIGDVLEVCPFDLMELYEK